MTKKSTAASTPEPAPVPTSGESVHDMVIADMAERKQFGLDKYKTILQAGNGRDPLVDAYQEALDLAVYIRQELEERSAKCDGYTKVTTHEWYFDCADSRWMLTWEDETHVDARRQGEWDRWVIGFAKGEDGTWWCEGTDAGEGGRFVPSDVCDAVTTHVLKHGVPA